MSMTVTDPDIIQIPVDGVLDLHAFHPRDVPSVVSEYIRACMEEGIFEIRIIHGKGKGVLRMRVHAVLERAREVLDYRLDTDRSGWGVTVVRLRRSPGGSRPDA